MTNQQLFAACQVLAPNFRIGIEYPVLGRSIVWRGSLTPTSPELSCGLVFQEGSEFEPKYTDLLTNAVLTLRTAAGLT